jgi:GTPase SAR1 family protein
MEKGFDLSINIGLLGSSDVGKTTLMRKFVN